MIRKRDTCHSKWNIDSFLTQLMYGLMLLLMAPVFTGCAGSSRMYNPEARFAPEALREDAAVLWETLERCHPSLTWYTPEDSIRSAFSQLNSRLTDSLTELQFRKQLSEPVARIRCGHTSLLPSKAASRHRPKSPGAFFPLQAKTWNGDSLIILANAFRNDSVLTRGTAILSINGVAVNHIIDSICHFISADGLHNSFRYQLISNNFPAWYKSIYGLSRQYELQIATADGSIRTATTTNFDPFVQDSLRKEQAKITGLYQRPAVTQAPPKTNRLENERKLTIDTARSLAIMELTTFSRARLPSFFRRSFKTLQKQGIKHLAIELRENGGGNIMNSTRLSRYLSDHPFKVADTVAAKSLRYPYPRQMKNGLIFKIQSWFVTSRRADGMRHYRMYERKVFQPYAKKHFNGQVYILTGGFTFSASTLFINPLKGQQNVKVIGEETGGGAYGNTAVNVPELVLPNTGIRVRIPLYRLVVSKDLPHDGRGILPDIYVPPTSWYLARRVDPKMMKVYELIRNL